MCKGREKLGYIFCERDVVLLTFLWEAFLASFEQEQMENFPQPKVLPWTKVNPF